MYTHTYACRCVCRDEESVKYMQWLVIPMEEFQVYVAVPTQVISYNLSSHANRTYVSALQINRRYRSHYSKYVSVRTYICMYTYVYVLNMYIRTNGPSMYLPQDPCLPLFNHKSSYHVR